MQLSEDVDKYVYFYSPEDSKDKINTFSAQYPGIYYVRNETFL